MQHSCAMQTGSGQWFYCRSGYPTGYCSPWDVCPECQKAGARVYDSSGADDCPTCHGRRRVERANPCPGHNTAEEACEHQRQYLLDRATYHQDTPEARSRASALHKCEAVLEGDPKDRWSDERRKTVKRCPEFTCGYASHGPYVHTILCPKHCNREFFAPLVSVGESWES